MNKVCSYIFILFVIISCDVFESNIYGCMDTNACNYNPDANVSFNDCEFEVDECGVCGGNTSGSCSLPGKPAPYTQETCEDDDGDWTVICE